MLAEAESRIHDAEILGTSLRSVGDSRALLNILALEVLLKAAQLKHSGTISRSHKYIEMWSSLPNHVRSEVLRIAQDRYPGHAELSNVEKLLCVYEFIFTKARYGYELYEDYTLAEQSGSGKSGSVAAPQQKKLTFNTSPWNCWPCLKAFARW
ncbi:MAG: hypothetical protein Q8L49_14025 [Burkholderiaceae bacterium]|nr:hypothetical protein [Burkholderiaceae bacterium]